MAIFVFLETLIANLKNRKLLAILSVVFLLTGAAWAGAPRQKATPGTAKKSAAAEKAASVKKKSSGRAAARRRPARRGRRAATPRGQAAPSPQRLREIQQALARSGHYDRQPSGQFDAATVAALQRFQRDHGLEPTGKLNALTLKKLGQFGLPAHTRASAAQTPPTALNP